jgi:hypothetical protein
LFNQGIEDALETLAKEVKKSKNVQAAYNEMDLFIRNVKKQMANNTLAGEEGEEELSFLLSL